MPETTQGYPYNTHCSLCGSLAHLRLLTDDYRLLTIASILSRHWAMPPLDISTV